MQSKHFQLSICSSAADYVCGSTCGHSDTALINSTLLHSSEHMSRKTTIATVHQKQVKSAFVKIIEFCKLLPFRNDYHKHQINIWANALGCLNDPKKQAPTLIYTRKPKTKGKKRSLLKCCWGTVITIDFMFSSRNYYIKPCKSPLQ